MMHIKFFTGFGLWFVVQRSFDAEADLAVEQTPQIKFLAESGPYKGEGRAFVRSGRVKADKQSVFQLAIIL